MNVNWRRRDLLRSAPFAVPAFKARLAQAAASAETIAGMNVILFLTDQERAIQHFPPGWEERNLPGMTRLRQHGLSFDRAVLVCLRSMAVSRLSMSARVRSRRPS
jgi:hypothetical protein